MVETGEILDIEIGRVTEDGKGIGYSYDGTMIIVENPSEEDRRIKVRVEQVLEATAFAKKVGRLKEEAQAVQREDIVESPYDLDEDEEFDEDE